jgi:hypothetical protein
MLAAPTGWPKKSDVSWIERMLVYDGIWGLHWLRRRNILDFMFEGEKLQKPDWKKEAIKE